MGGIGAQTAGAPLPSKRVTGMTDTTIRVNGTEYNVVIYRADDTGAWRAEAAHGGRVVEVIDTPSEAAARDGIRKRLEARK